MYTEYTERKTSFWERIKKLFLVLLSISIFTVGIIIIVHMMHILPGKQKKAYEELAKKEEEFLKRIDLSIIEAGYLKRSAGIQDVYVPALVVQIANTSEEESEQFMLTAYLKRERKTICKGSIAMNNLGAGETREVILKCLELLVFGTVFKGLSLIQTSKELQYDIWIDSEGVSIKIVEGRIKFNILSTPFRYPVEQPSFR